MADALADGVRFGQLLLGGAGAVLLMAAWLASGSLAPAEIHAGPPRAP